MSDLRPNIWRLQAHFDIPGLIEALKNDDPGVRKRAATALRTLSAVQAVVPLQEALKGEKDPDARNSISAALDYLLPEQIQTLPTLVAQLRSSQPEVIISATRALSELKDRTAVEHLVIVFHNLQLPGRVRLAAAEALIKLESAPAVVTLLAALRSKNWYVRRNAAAVLGQLRADWAVDPLSARLSDENEVVRRTARAALRRIHTPEAFAALEADGQVRPRAIAPEQKPPGATAPLQTSVVKAAVAALSAPAEVKSANPTPTTDEAAPSPISKAHPLPSEPLPPNELPPPDQPLTAVNSESEKE